MFSGFYTLASGMLTQQRNLDVIGNNMINGQTPGYRADSLEISAFEKELLSRETAQGDLYYGAGAPAAIVSNVYQLMHGGTIKNTERNMDIAVDGSGFFNIQAATDNNVTYLTRNGQFDVDAEGYLELPGFGRVLGTNGQPLQVQNEHFTVEEDGNIFRQDGTLAGTLQLTVTDGTLVKLENGMFQLPQGANAMQATGFRTVQGNLELSNVDMNREMSNLIVAQRAFQNNSAALQILDSINEKSASQIASIGG